MDANAHIRKLHFRATHRGTREADAMIGGFFEAHSSKWNAAELAWFEQLLEEQDVDIMAWAIGKTVPPDHFQGPMMDALQKLDFIKLPDGLK